ncbi:MED6-domain-containing protein [Exidia glandulosa HHB12029]|uniref:Mediator of RNA polymerase II transcription subunit 6 n=1 Tax=Exidia glandulosa HHB12029 TaxID=1314781 RepID=A0A165PFS4_EXIGL|nr:MED6-domain-containing protein [Exidia glandulosa HHB12029]
MFYDKQSNNQVLRMQTIHTGVALKNEAEELRRFTGIEFAVVKSEPPTLFVIQKRNRLSPDEAQPLVAYFILQNRIYQAPDVYSVISNRLLTTLHALQASLETIRSHRPNFTPRLGFVWPIVDNSPASQGAGDSATQRKNRSSAEPPDTGVAEQQSDEPVPAVPSTSAVASKKAVNLNPLFLAMRTTAGHASTTFVPHFRDATAPAGAPEPAAPPSASPAPPGPATRAGSTDAPPPKKKRKKTTAAATPSLS